MRMFSISALFSGSNIRERTKIWFCFSLYNQFKVNWIHYMSFFFLLIFLLLFLFDCWFSSMSQAFLDIFFMFFWLLPI